MLSKSVLISARRITYFDSYLKYDSPKNHFKVEFIKHKDKLFFTYFVD